MTVSAYVTGAGRHLRQRAAAWQNGMRPL